MQKLIVGSTVLASGLLTRGQLRWNYRPVYPDVYLRKDLLPTLRARSFAAWLWSGGRAVVAGRAAAAMHRAEWIDDDIPVELIHDADRSPSGMIVRNERLATDEITRVDHLPVTTAERTALDLGRHLTQFPALKHLDSLARAKPVDLDAVVALTRRYAGARGVARARRVVPLTDAGAQSPKESWLRLVLINAGFPRPQTQIHVSDGFRNAYIDLGWEEPKIGLDYEGDHHRALRDRYVRDIGRYELIESQGWADLRVVSEHSAGFVTARVRDIFERRGWERSGHRRRDCA